MSVGKEPFVAEAEDGLFPRDFVVLTRDPKIGEMNI